MVKILPKEPSLGELLGKGFSTGFSKGMEEQSALRKALALQTAKEESRAKGLMNQPLTPYQETLTKQRQEAQNQHLSSEVFKYIKGFADMSTDPKLMTMKTKDLLSIHKNAMSKIKTGMSAPEAIEYAFTSFFEPKSESLKSEPIKGQESTEERITVISKDGKLGTIPKSQLRDAYKLGYRKR